MSDEDLKLQTVEDDKAHYDRYYELQEIARRYGEEHHAAIFRHARRRDLDTSILVAKYTQGALPHDTGAC